MPDEPDPNDQSQHETLKNHLVIQPPEKDPAVELIRQKIQNLYRDEPDAKEEIAEVSHIPNPLAGSKHQQYISQLNASGMSLAEIQTAWHTYYVGLPDNEKYEVWQEFYVQQGNPAYQQYVTPAQPVQHIATPQPQQPAAPAPTMPVSPLFAAAPAAPTTQAAGTTTTTQLGEDGTAFEIPTVTPAIGTSPAMPKVLHKAIHHRVTRRGRALQRSVKSTQGKLGKSKSAEKAAVIKNRIVETVKTAASSDGRGKLTRKHHLQSALFGLACGALVLFIFLFSFFNEVIIAPLIQPSRNVNDTPVIVDTASANISGGTKIIIPKINLEIPVDYSQTSLSESVIETALDSGVVHYPSTVMPGQTGNTAFFGHSSNNIFNPGKYKFAFVLLHELVPGDVFYLNYNGTTYAYKVFDKKIVSPDHTEVLLPVPGHSATATLITCDPPGTSINRLIITADQISPDPNTNTQSATQTATTTDNSSASSTDSEASSLPGNGPSLWTRIMKSIF